jgi:hypothetical protein
LNWLFRKLSIVCRGIYIYLLWFQKWTPEKDQQMLNPKTRTENYLLVNKDSC